MKKWIGKLTAIFASAVLMMGAAMPVCATESESAGNWPVDTEKTDCSISLTLKYTEEGSTTEKNMSGGDLSIYTVATVKAENGYSFDISGGKFAGSEEVAGIPGMDSAALDQKNAEIADALDKKITGVEADQTVAVADGACKFENLTPGLYLVRQSTDSEGGIKINPFLVSIPGEDGSYNIEAAPKKGIEVPVTPTPSTKITPTPTPGKPGTPPSGSKSVLPQTGQLWWPVPVLCGAGLALVIGGYMLKRRKTA